MTLAELHWSGFAPLRATTLPAKGLNVSTGISELWEAMVCARSTDCPLGNPLERTIDRWTISGGRLRVPLMLSLAPPKRGLG